MQALFNWGYTAVPISVVLDALIHGGELPEKPIVITFDDVTARQLTLAWNDVRRLVVIEVTDRETDDDDDGASAEPEPDLQDPLGPQSVIVRLPVGMARGFAARCAASMSGGRPNCPFCGSPLDPSGHICARANGYKR